MRDDAIFILLLHRRNFGNDQKGVKRMKQMEIGDFTRISKREARKLYQKREEFYATGSNLRPGSPWFPEVLIGSPHNYQNQYTFDDVMASFEYYNRPPVLFWISPAE